MTYCAPSTRPSTRGSTTSRPTRSSSRTAPRWPAGSAAESCPRPRTTCSRSATSCSTRGCRQPASTGTRCPTGAAPQASAGTTSATGTAAGGGGPGPGAHSCVGATRWWNVKHPNMFASLLAENALPAADFEELTDEQAHTEVVMLAIRLRTGLPVSALTADERRRADVVIADGLLRPEADRLVLTDRGRLLADAVVRTLLDA